MRGLPGLLLSVFIFCGIARADVVVFKNGDQLTGTVVSAVHDHITLASEVAGTVTIPTDKVESVSVEKTAVVVAATKQVMRGQVRFVPTGEWEVTEGGKTEIVKAESVQAILTEEAYHQQYEENHKLWNGWKGVANFGYSIQSGDQRARTLSTAVTATKEGSYALIFRPHWRLNWDLTALLSHAEQQETSVRSNTISTNLREDYLLSSRDFLFVAGGLDHINAQGLYLRQRLGAGFGYDLISNPRMSLKALLGVNYIHAKFYIGPTTRSAEGSLGENFGWQLGRRIHVDHVLYFYPGFSGGSGYRGETRSNLGIRLNNRLTFNTGLVDFYLRHPPAGSRKNNMAVTTGLGVTF